MKNIYRNSALWITFLVVLSFSIFAFLFSAPSMIEIASGLMLGMAVTVVLLWAGTTIRAIRAGPSEGPGMLAMGITGIAFMMFAQRLWGNYVRWEGRPDYLVDSYMTAFMIWCTAAAWLLIILAPGTRQNDIPTRNYVWFIFAGGVGIFFAGLSVGASLIKLAE